MNKPELDQLQPLIPQLNSKLNNVGTQFEIDLDDRELIVTLDSPAELSYHHLTIEDSDNHKFVVIGTVSRPDTDSFFKYMLLDENDKNLENPLLYLVDVEEPVLKYSKKVQFYVFWNQLKEVETT